MKSTKEAEQEIIEVLEGTSSDVIKSQDICLHDCLGVENPARSMARLLAQLKGKKIIEVAWVNQPNRDWNPDGTIGHFSIRVV